MKPNLFKFESVVCTLTSPPPQLSSLAVRRDEFRKVTELCSAHNDQEPVPYSCLSFASFTGAQTPFSCLLSMLQLGRCCTNTQNTLNDTVLFEILPVVLYGCESWSL